MRPDFVVAGHITRDVIDGQRWRLGGSVLYAALQADKLGMRVGALTSCAEDVEPEILYPEITWQIIQSRATTTFENRYEGSARSQRLLALADPLDIDTFPEEWRQAPTVFLAPVFQELELDITTKWSGSRVAVSAQGWLRDVVGDVVVRQKTPRHGPWPRCNVVFVSQEDIDDDEVLTDWRGWSDIVVLTRAGRGATLWDNDGRHDVPALPSRQVDPTGAGDVFAAAFMVRYAETDDAPQSARFATAAAALSIEAEGTDGIADREAIEARQQQVARL